MSMPNRLRNLQQDPTFVVYFDGKTATVLRAADWPIVARAICYDERNDVPVDAWRLIVRAQRADSVEGRWLVAGDYAGRHAAELAGADVPDTIRRIAERIGCPPGLADECIRKAETVVFGAGAVEE